jgi:hypothetical protein
VPIPTKEYSKPGVCLAIYIKKYLMAKEELLFKYFTMQKYNLKKQKETKSFKIS